MINPEIQRRNLERQALRRFKEIASHYPFPIYDGQRHDNRIAQIGRSYFQFGDLRVDMPGCHLVVEVESAGGVTNLVKYWYCIEEGLITKPLKLLHLFAQVSANDYIRHLLLWDSLRTKMNDALGERFTAERHTYRSPRELEDIASVFEQYLISLS